MFDCGWVPPTPPAPVSWSDSSRNWFLNHPVKSHVAAHLNPSFKTKTMSCPPLILNERTIRQKGITLINYCKKLLCKYEKTM
jgi:hypothetical protein